MKSAQKFELVHVQVSYWTCSKPMHRHKTHEVAERCIAKSDRPKKATNVWTPESRRALLGRWRETGMTKTALAAEYGVSCNRMCQVIGEAEREELRVQRDGIPWTDGLSTRAANALKRRGFTSKDQVRTTLANGALAPGENLGRVSIDEIARWLESDGSLQ